MNLSRKGFLLGAAATGAAGLLSACSFEKKQNTTKNTSGVDKKKPYIRYLIKHDHPLIKEAYGFCAANSFINKQNMHGVAGTSVFSIQAALSNILNYKTEFIGGKRHRPWIDMKEKSLNRHCSNNKIIQVVNIGYIDANSTTPKDFVCADVTWTPYMNKQPHTLPHTDCFLMSGSYLLASATKVSFGFFKNKNLAHEVQNELYMLTAGLSYADIARCENSIKNKKQTKERYHYIKSINAMKSERFKAIINKYNAKNNTLLKVLNEPTGSYLYLSANNIEDLNRFIDIYTKSKTKDDIDIFAERKSLMAPGVGTSMSPGSLPLDHPKRNHTNGITFELHNPTTEWQQI